jgi:hypothetical protein
MNHPGNTGGDRGIDHVLDALYIGVAVGLVGLVGLAEQGGNVKDAIDPRHGAIQSGPIADITAHDFDSRMIEVNQLLLTAGHRPNLIATGQQLADNFRSDKSGGARY